MKRKIFTTLCLLSLLADAFASSVSTNKTFMLNDGTGGTTDNALPPNETNFFNANYGWLDMAAIPPGGVFGSEEWIVSQLDPPGIYVDSVLGSDSNPGTETLPLQHLAAVTALLGGNSTVATNIYLKRGSKFYESFVVPTNAFVCDYSIGVKPIITGVTNLNNAGFTLTAGKTNTYQLPLIVPIETKRFLQAILCRATSSWSGRRINAWARVGTRTLLTTTTRTPRLTPSMATPTPFSTI